MLLQEGDIATKSEFTIVSWALLKGPFGMVHGLEMSMD